MELDRPLAALGLVLTVIGAGLLVGITLSSLDPVWALFAAFGCSIVGFTGVRYIWGSISRKRNGS